MYRHWADGVQYLLVHPGGPYWARKDTGAWSIPKGEYASEEDALSVAIRELTEETGVSPHGPFQPLGEIVQPGRKVVTAWAAEGDFDPKTFSSNRFEMEWPPRSGQMQTFPEVDRAEWFAHAEAKAKIVSGQRPFITRLAQRVRGAVRKFDDVRGWTSSTSTAARGSLRKSAG